MSVTNRPIRILFVCHGNICRSPMAEFIFKDMVRQVGLADQFEIASAATSREEIWHGKGNPVYPPAKAELAAHGLSCDGKRARQLTVADYDYYDLLLAMDGSNVRNLHRMLGGDPQHKIKKLLNYAHGGDVADPWYSRDFAPRLPGYRHRLPRPAHRPYNQIKSAPAQRQCNFVPGYFYWLICQTTDWSYSNFCCSAYRWLPAAPHRSADNGRSPAPAGT